MGALPQTGVGLAALWLFDEGAESGRQLVAPVADEYWSDWAWSPGGKSVAYAVLKDVTSGGGSQTLRIGINVADVQTGQIRELSHLVGVDMPSGSPGRPTACT
jgi:hypothetical protein